ncbi:MAG: tRNA 2-thiocytidine(32) synthetase TtcA [Deltaproteobacteria bacterium]|nr:tRNA 2-thiocytidine(32) synthetase TtcA [Deltaproteobacteria bacterium]
MTFFARFATVLPVLSKSTAADEEAVDRLKVRLLKQVRRTCKRYQLLAAGDRILVAVSGGKDSFTMLELMAALKDRLPFRIELIAVHLDQRQPGYDGAPLVGWLEQRGLPFEILSEDTYGVVKTHVEEGGTYCSLCSRLRRGILYTAAQRLGCNKLALGHHREDTLETFLLNLFFAGKMQAMPPHYTTDDGTLGVIRPLLECSEAEIAEYARRKAFPILPCNLCGSQPGLKRDMMGAFIERLEAVQPNVRATMMNALSNIRPTHMLDPEVLEAWHARPPHVRPVPEVARRTEHASAEPIRSSLSRLPIIDA